MEVKQSEESLLSTQRALLRSHEVGQATTVVLHTQREQIVRTRDTVRITDDVLSRAKRTLQRIARRTVTNKLITGTVILLELGAVGLIIWYRWGR